MYKYRRNHHTELQLDLGKTIISLVMLSNVMENIYQYTFRSTIFILAHLSPLHLMISPGWLPFLAEISFPVPRSPLHTRSLQLLAQALQRFHLTFILLNFSLIAF